VLPTAADLRAQRRGHRWRWARAAVFALALAAPPKAGHHAYLAGVYIAGTVVFAVLPLYQSLRAIWTGVPLGRWASPARWCSARSDGSWCRCGGEMDEPPKLEIPDVKVGLPPRYVLAEKLSFSPPQASSFVFPAAKTWNAAGEPDLVFGAPDGWSEVPAHTLTWFAAERENTPPEAPILQDTRILTAFEHPGAGGIPWQVQLRKSVNPVGQYVMRYPGNWADAKSRWCESRAPSTEGWRANPQLS
jgi:hypothetical protein